MAYSNEQLALRAHIEALNAKTREWLSQGEGRWATELSEDLDFWAEMGVTSVARFERDQLISFIWDAHKDAFGSRPRHLDFDAMSMAQLEEEADYCARMAAVRSAQERAEQEAEILNFEEQVEQTIGLGAGTRAKAVEWILDAEEINGDIEYFCFLRGLPYSYEHTIRSYLRGE